MEHYSPDSQAFTAEGVTDLGVTYRIVASVVHEGADPSPLEKVPLELLAQIMLKLPPAERREAMHQLKGSSRYLNAAMWDLRYVYPICSQHVLDAAAADPGAEAITVDTDLGALTYTATRNAAVKVQGSGELILTGTGETHLIADPATPIKVEAGTIHAHNARRVTALAGSIVHARDGSSVQAQAGSIVHAYGTSRVGAGSHSEVYAHDSSSILAHHAIVHAQQNSHVSASHCTVQACGTGRVRAEYSTVILSGGATASMPVRNTLILEGECRFTAEGPISLTLPDGSTVEDFVGDGPYGGV
jgi:hypothetical protein